MNHESWSQSRRWKRKSLLAVGTRTLSDHWVLLTTAVEDVRHLYLWTTPCLPACLHPGSASSSSAAAAAACIQRVVRVLAEKLVDGRYWSSMDHQASVHAWFVARTRERTDSCCQRRFNRVLTHANCTANTESRLSVRQIVEASRRTAEIAASNTKCLTVA